MTYRVIIKYVMSTNPNGRQLHVVARKGAGVIYSLRDQTFERSAVKTVTTIAVTGSVPIVQAKSDDLSIETGSQGVRP